MRKTNSKNNPSKKPYSFEERYYEAIVLDKDDSRFNCSYTSNSLNDLLTSLRGKLIRGNEFNVYRKDVIPHFMGGENEIITTPVGCGNCHSKENGSHYLNYLDYDSGKIYKIERKF